MSQGMRAGQCGGYGRMAFSDRVQRLRKIRRTAWATTRSASLAEVHHVLALARDHLPGLASDSVVGAVLSHNPDVVQVLETAPGSEPRSFLAVLPLNAVGVRDLVGGKLDTTSPGLSLLCRAGEQPAAIYVWLAFAPGNFMITLLALDGFLARKAPEACPLFARAPGPQAASLFHKMGFVTAADVYAGAPDDLLGLPPLSGFPLIQPEASQKEEPLKVRVARTMDDIVRSFSIRSATYISEQLCPFDEEFDGNDFCATHFIGEIQGEPAGCLRVRFFAGFVKIERLAVRHEYRNSRLAFRLVREALLYARKKGYRRAYGHSRIDLIRFWGFFGFRPLAGRAPFMFSDVQYVELEAELGEEKDAIAIGADPYVLIRPEGEWDRPGPLDRSALRTRKGAGA